MQKGIPNYLKPYFVVTKDPKTLDSEFSIGGNIKCNCGCESFTIMREKWNQTSESKEAEKQIQKLIEKHNEMKKDGGSICLMSKQEKDFIVHVDFKTGKEKLLEDVTDFRRKAFDGKIVPTIMEAICSHCGKKILIFDSRKYGYNALVDTSKKEYSEDYSIILKSKCRKCGNENSKISITISNTGKNDLFAECGELINEKNWEDAFDWITVDLKCNGCEKETKKYLDLETM